MPLIARIARHRLLPPSAAWLALGALVGALFGTGALAQDEAPEAQVPPFEIRDKLPFHTGTYAPPQIAWTVDSRVTNVWRVIPDPSMTDRIYVLAGESLWRTDDAAGSWKTLPAVSPATTGHVNDIAFYLGRPDTLYFATAERGVWVTTDGGQTAKRLADTSAGLKSNVIAHVYVHPADPTGRSLLVVHGREAAGLGYTFDGGKSWQYERTGFYPYRVKVGHANARGLFILAAPTSEPDVTNLYFAESVGQFWQKLMPDVLATDMAQRVNTGDVFLTTFDTGVTRLSWGAKVMKGLGRDDVEWFSADTAWASDADHEAVYLYEPSKLGMVRSTDDLATFTSHNRGLMVGSFVTEGSHIRANANGTMFYGGINGSLFVGRNVSPMRVESVTVSPAAMRIDQAVFSTERWDRFDSDLSDLTQAADIGPLAASLVRQLEQFDKAIDASQITITAKVVAPEMPAQVTVDLSRLRRSARTPMFDDGAHGDGQANDGVYGLQLVISRKLLEHQDREWRSTWPGPIGLTVTAAGAQGKLAGAVGKLSIYIEPDTYTFIDDGNPNTGGREGLVETEFISDAKLAQHGRKFLRFTVGPGDWMLPIGNYRSRHNIGGFYAVSFWLMPEGPPSAELNVHLRDNPTYSYPDLTPPVPIVAEGYIEGGKLVPGEYRRVVVPLERMLRKSGDFQRDLVGWIALSGSDSAAHTYRIDNIRFVMDKADLGNEEDDR